MAKVKSKKITLEEALVPAEEQPYKVPENWCWTYLLNGFAECKDGNRKPINASERAEREGDIPYYGATGQAGWIDDYLTDEQLVLLGEDGAPFLELLKDKAYLIEGKAWVNNHAHIIKSHYGEVGNKYILHYLNVFNFHGYVNGTTRLKLTQASMRTIPVPLPPLAEQKRIVEQIENLFAKLDEAREKAQEILDTFNDRKAAILYKAFQGNLTKQWRKEHSDISAIEYLRKIEKSGEDFSKKEFKFWESNELPKTWAESKIGNLLYFAGRIGWKGLKADEYTEEGPLLLSVYNLNDGDEVSYNRVYHITTERYEESPEIMVEIGDVLLTKDGAGIGKLGYVKELPQEATINSSLLLIRPGNTAISKYIFYLLSGPELQSIVKERITGSATPHLFQRDIKEFTIPIPPLEEQEEIVRILDDVLEKEKIAYESAENVISQIELMKKSILAKAFRGELGTNNPEEESSSELLKSIIEGEK